MDIKKLLFVTKFEELCFDAMKSLLPLRDVSLNHVVFCNVIEREKVAMHRGLGYQKKDEIRLREKANIRFIDWAEDLFELGMEVGVYIVVGNLVSEVIEAAEKEAVDLVVIGRSIKSVFKQLYGGSDVSELTKRLSTPVLVYKAMSGDTRVLDKPFERPLLAMDWSPADFRAIEYLLKFKNITKKVDIIHVADDKVLTGDSAMAVQKTRKETRRKLEAICDRFEAAGIEAEPHVHIGDAVSEIEQSARENQNTLVVLGSSGKSLWAERWLGSVPRDIAEKSPYPALLIPPSKT